MSQLKPSAPSQQTDPARTADEMLSQLRRAPDTFFAASSSARHWVRGGEPGEGYTSEILELGTAISREPQKSVEVQEAYVRTCFDMEYEPPFRAERFALSAEPRDAAKFVIRVLESPVFRKHFPEETAPQVADILKETWVVRHGKIELSKTFYEPFPKEMDELRKASRDLRKSILAKGQRSILSTKKK